jgi:hypothetical protein
MSGKWKINRPQLSACVLGVLAVVAVSVVSIRCSSGRNVAAPVVIVNPDTVAADTAAAAKLSKFPRVDKREKNHQPVQTDKPKPRDYRGEINN